MAEGGSDTPGAVLCRRCSSFLFLPISDRTPFFRVVFESSRFFVIYSIISYNYIMEEMYLLRLLIFF